MNILKLIWSILQWMDTVTAALTYIQELPHDYKQDIVEKYAAAKSLYPAKKEKV